MIKVEITIKDGIYKPVSFVWNEDQCRGNVTVLSSNKKKEAGQITIRELDKAKRILECCKEVSNEHN